MEGDAFSNRTGDWRWETAANSEGLPSPSPALSPGNRLYSPSDGEVVPENVSKHGSSVDVNSLDVRADSSDPNLLSQAAEIARNFLERQSDKAADEGPSREHSSSPSKHAGEDGDEVTLLLLDDGRIVTEGDGSTVGEIDANEGAVAATLETVSWRVQPTAVHPTVNLEKNFAWCPWTKTYVPLERPLRIKRLWCWQLYNLNWWTAFLFVLGSVGFFTGAIFASLRLTHAAEHRGIKIWGEMMPYLSGGICFVAGALTLCITTAELVDWDFRRDDPGYETLPGKKGSSEYDGEPRSGARTPTEPPVTRWLGKWEVAPAPGEGLLNRPLTLPRRESSGCRVRRNAAAELEFQRLWIEYDPWTRRQHMVELVGAVLIFLGTLFYKAGLFSDLYETLSDPLPPHWRFFMLQGTLQIGSVMFVVGGYLLLAAFGQTWFPFALARVNPRTAGVAWWIVMLNMIGSMFFLLGAMPLQVPAPSLVANTYVQNIFGWGLGSVFFFVQSWLMVIEVASAEDDDSPDDDAMSIRNY